MATRTDEEKREWRQKMGDLARRVREMGLDERNALALKYGTTTCEGHQLSAYNTVFLAMQTETLCVMVGGVRQWRKVGRQVIKGQHAAGYIYVPMGKRNNDDGDVEVDDTVRFRLIPMFDVTQTADVEKEAKVSAGSVER